MTVEATQHGSGQHNSHWYIRSDNAEAVPLTEQQLREMAANGQLVPEDLVSRDRNRWVAAAEVKGLTFGLDAQRPDSKRDRASTGASQSAVQPASSLPRAKPLKTPPPVPKHKQSRPTQRQPSVSSAVERNAEFSCSIKEPTFTRTHDGKAVFSMHDATFSSDSSPLVCKLSRSSVCSDLIIHGGIESKKYKISFKTSHGKRTFVLTSDAAEVFREWAGVGLVHAVDRKRAKGWGTYFLVADLIGLAITSVIILQGKMEGVLMAGGIVAVILHLVGLGVGVYCLDRGSRLGLNLVAFSWLSFALYNFAFAGIAILEPSSVPKDLRETHTIACIFFGLVQMWFGVAVYWQCCGSKAAELRHASEDMFAGWLGGTVTGHRSRRTPKDSGPKRATVVDNTPRASSPTAENSIEERICADFHPMNPVIPDVEAIVKIGNAATRVLINLFWNPQTEYGLRSQPLLAATLARLAHEGDSEAYEFLKLVASGKVPVVNDRTGDAALKVAVNCIEGK